MYNATENLEQILSGLLILIFSFLSVSHKTVSIKSHLLPSASQEEWWPSEPKLYPFSYKLRELTKKYTQAFTVYTEWTTDQENLSYKSIEHNSQLFKYNKL